jgi:hypothetical protein
MDRLAIRFFVFALFKVRDNAPTTEVDLIRATAV